MIIKYSNYFDGLIRNAPLANFRIFDLSTDNELANNYFVNPHEENQLLKKYSTHETFIQTDFLLSTLGIELPFTTPNSIKISFITSEEFNGLNKQIKDLRRIRNKSGQDDIELDILESLKKNFKK